LEFEFEFADERGGGVFSPDEPIFELGVEAVELGLGLIQGDRVGFEALAFPDFAENDKHVESLKKRKDEAMEAVFIRFANEVVGEEVLERKAQGIGPVEMIVAGEESVDFIVGILTVDFLEVLGDGLVVVMEDVARQFLEIALDVEGFVVVFEGKFSLTFFEETVLVIGIPETVLNPFTEDNVFSGDLEASGCLLV